MRLASRPPYSFGQETTAHLASNNARSQSRCDANPSRVSPDGRSCGTFAVNHARASARNASSASVNVRSTTSLLLHDHRGAVAEEALVDGESDAGAVDLAARGLTPQLPDE